MTKNEAFDKLHDLAGDNIFLDGDEISSATIDESNKEEFENCLYVLGWQDIGNNSLSNDQIEMLFIEK